MLMVGVWEEGASLTIIIKKMKAQRCNVFTDFYFLSRRRDFLKV